MIILDTSVWIDHLRKADPGVVDALNAARIANHPWVAGELALGGAASQVLGLLDQLPQALVAEPIELRAFIREAKLARTGIGWVDTQLLASARLSGAVVATSDRKLRTQADRLGLLARL